MLHIMDIFMVELQTFVKQVFIMLLKSFALNKPHILG